MALPCYTPARQTGSQAPQQPLPHLVEAVPEVHRQRADERLEVPGHRREPFVSIRRLRGSSPLTRSAFARVRSLGHVSAPGGPDRRPGALPRRPRAAGLHRSSARWALSIGADRRRCEVATARRTPRHAQTGGTPWRFATSSRTRPEASANLRTSSARRSSGCTTASTTSSAAR